MLFSACGPEQIKINHQKEKRGRIRLSPNNNKYGLTSRLTHNRPANQLTQILLVFDLLWTKGTRIIASFSSLFLRLSTIRSYVSFTIHFIFSYRYVLLGFLDILSIPFMYFRGENISLNLVFIPIGYVRCSYIVRCIAGP